MGDFDLMDIKDVVINTELSAAERMADFERQLGGLGRFRHGKLVVRLCFADAEDTFADRLEAASINHVEPIFPSVIFRRSCGKFCP